MTDNVMCIGNRVRVLFDKGGVDGADAMLEEMYEKKINRVFRFPLL